VLLGILGNCGTNNVGLAPPLLFGQPTQTCAVRFL